MAATRKRDHRALFWAMSPVLLLGGLLGTQLLLLGNALDDPSFSVEDDYYEKALSWDAKMAQQRENARLGWTVGLSPVGFGEAGVLHARVTDASGAPVDGATVEVEAFPNARASRVRSVSLREQEPGLYVGALPFERPGLWEFRVSVQRKLDKFSEVVRKDVVTKETP